MAVIITASDVKSIQATSIPDSVIADIITTVDAADTCLDGNSVPDATQRLLKLYAAAHLVYQSTNGNVKSERSPTGASRTYKDTASGVDGSPWGAQLKQLDQYGCVTNLIMRDATVYFGSVGPGGRRGNVYDRTDGESE